MGQKIKKAIKEASKVYREIFIGWDQLSMIRRVVVMITINLKIMTQKTQMAL